MINLNFNYVNSKLVRSFLGAILVFHGLAIEKLSGEIQFIELLIGMILLSVSTD